MLFYIFSYATIAYAGQMSLNPNTYELKGATSFSRAMTTSEHLKSGCDDDGGGSYCKWLCNQKSCDTTSHWCNCGVCEPFSWCQTACLARTCQSGYCCTCGVCVLQGANESG